MFCGRNLKSGDNITIFLVATLGWKQVSCYGLYIVALIVDSLSFQSLKSSKTLLAAGYKGELQFELGLKGSLRSQDADKRNFRPED